MGVIVSKVKIGSAEGGKQLKEKSAKNSKVNAQNDQNLNSVNAVNGDGPGLETADASPVQKRAVRTISGTDLEDETQYSWTVISVMPSGDQSGDVRGLDERPEVDSDRDKTINPFEEQSDFHETEPVQTNIDLNKTEEIDTALQQEVRQESLEVNHSPYCGLEMGLEPVAMNINDGQLAKNTTVIRGKGEGLDDVPSKVGDESLGYPTGRTMTVGIVTHQDWVVKGDGLPEVECVVGRVSAVTGDHFNTSTSMIPDHFSVRKADESAPLGDNLKMEGADGNESQNSSNEARWKSVSTQPEHSGEGDDYFGDGDSKITRIHDTATSGWVCNSFNEPAAYWSGTCEIPASPGGVKRSFSTPPYDAPGPRDQRPLTEDIGDGAEEIRNDFCGQQAVDIDWNTVYRQKIPSFSSPVCGSEDLHTKISESINQNDDIFSLTHDKPEGNVTWSSNMKSAFPSEQYNSSVWQECGSYDQMSDWNGELAEKQKLVESNEEMLMASSRSRNVSGSSELAAEGKTDELTTEMKDDELPVEVSDELAAEGRDGELASDKKDELTLEEKDDELSAEREDDESTAEGKVNEQNEARDYELYSDNKENEFTAVDKYDESATEGKDDEFTAERNDELQAAEEYDEIPAKEKDDAFAVERKDELHVAEKEEFPAEGEDDEFVPDRKVDEFTPYEREYDEFVPDDGNDDEIAHDERKDNELHAEEKHDYSPAERKDDELPAEAGDYYFSDKKNDEFSTEGQYYESATGGKEDVSADKEKEDVFAESKDEELSYEGKDDKLSVEGRHEELSAKGNDDELLSESKDDEFTAEAKDELVTEGKDNELESEVKEYELSAERKDDVFSERKDEEFTAEERDNTAEERDDELSDERRDDEFTAEKNDMDYLNQESYQKTLEAFELMEKVYAEIQSDDFSEATKPGDDEEPAADEGFDIPSVESYNVDDYDLYCDCATEEPDAWPGETAEGTIYDSVSRPGYLQEESEPESTHQMEYSYSTERSHENSDDVDLDGVPAEKSSAAWDESKVSLQSYNDAFSGAQPSEEDGAFNFSGVRRTGLMPSWNDSSSLKEDEYARYDQETTNNNEKNDEDSGDRRSYGGLASEDQGYDPDFGGASST